MKNPKILITGAAGYVGKNTVLFLKKNKNLNLILTDKKNKPKINLFKSLKYLKYNLNNNLFEKLVKINPDIIIHLAALTSVTDSEKNKSIYYKNNFLVTKNICYYCKNFNKKIIFASSAAIYKSQTFSLKENDPRYPKNYYGKTKLMSEKIIIKQLTSKSSYIILRFFNIAGGDKKNKITFSNYNFPVFKLIAQAIKKNKKFLIFGKNPKNNKTAIRDYIHVNDIANIIKHSIDHLRNKKKSLVLNCCTGLKTSVLDLIKLFMKISKRKLNFEITKKRKGEDFIFFGNNKRLKRELKIKPKFNIMRIIKDSYESIS